MGDENIMCDECGSTNVTREAGCAVVQRISPETNEPIGKEGLFFFFRCQSCGEQLFREDVEGYIN